MSLRSRLFEGLVLFPPEGYAERPAERGLAFVGPAGEALTVAAASVDLTGPEAQQRMARDRLVQGAIKDIQKAVCQPDLEVLVPLSKAPGAEGIETWNLVARSDAGRLFAQAVVASEASVAVLALDGRMGQEAVAGWFGMLESVRGAS